MEVLRIGDFPEDLGDRSRGLQTGLKDLEKHVEYWRDSLGLETG